VLSELDLQKSQFFTPQRATCERGVNPVVYDVSLVASTGLFF